MRGQLLGTTGKKLEKVGVRDFCDIVYAYAINSPQHRSDFRSSFLGYTYDFKEAVTPGDEDMSFEGFSQQATSMLDELDAFTNQLG